MSESSDQLQEPANPELIRLMPREKMVEAARMIVSAGQGMLEATGHPDDDAARHFGAIMAAFPYAVILAGAFLAREDDGPITEEWLQEMGAVEESGEWSLPGVRLTARRGVWSICPVDIEHLVVEVTRRHVRLLQELIDYVGNQHYPRPPAQPES